MKMFGSWESEGIKVNDPGLVKYINLTPRYIPHSHGRFAKDRFGKSKMHIVERLINKVSVVGHKGKKHWRTSENKTGKKQLSMDVVKSALEIIEKKTKQNPIEVLVRAVEHSAPREEVTTIEIGGIRVPKSVDVAPQRRVDLSLRWIAQGAFQTASNSHIPIEEALANEIIAAANGDTKSFAVSKMIEVERQAAASR